MMIGTLLYSVKKGEGVGLPHIGVLLIAGCAILIGAIVQGGVGFGIGIVGAPIVTLLDPGVMPGAIIITSIMYPVLTILHEWRNIDLGGVGWALCGRMAGTAAGVWVVGMLSPRAIGVAVGCMVLLAVGLSIRATRVPGGAGALAGAGLVSGVTGTAVGIGGPPIALVYQQAAGARIRATLAVFFLVGGVVSLCSLAVTGELHARELSAGAALIPWAALGFVLARPLRRYLDGGRTRTAVLVAVCASAAVLLAKSLL